MERLNYVCDKRSNNSRTVLICSNKKEIYWHAVIVVNDSSPMIAHKNTKKLSCNHAPLFAESLNRSEIFLYNSALIDAYFILVPLEHNAPGRHQFCLQTFHTFQNIYSATPLHFLLKRPLNSASLSRKYTFSFHVQIQ